LPKPNIFHLNILRFLSDRAPHSSLEIKQWLQRRMKPSAAQLRKTGGRKSEFEDGADVALANLQGAPNFSWGKLVRKKDEIYRITADGIQFLRASTPEGRSTRANQRNALGSRSVTQSVLFARIGEMTYYAGPQKGGEKPSKGGGYNRSKIGHEFFNFFQKFPNYPGRLFGFVQPGGGSHKQIKLEKIDPTSARGADMVSNVTVVFVANQRIVGWYKRATVHRRRVNLPSEVVRDIQRRLNQAGVAKQMVDPFIDFAVACDSKDATLLPTSERSFQIKGRGRGSFGQSNVRYLYDSKGTRRVYPWMARAIEFVSEYAKGNLLETPSLENNSEEWNAIAEERAAGFQSNVTIRKEIEKHSMRVAEGALRARGYGSLVDTSRYREYDFTCRKKGREFFVEVKGTQTGGKTVFLTKNEVAHASRHARDSIIIIVRSIKISADSAVRASGGTTVIREPWKPLQKDLTAIQYVWCVR
jgi:hypothetical protein